jgi:hypothetical protein
MIEPFPRPVLEPDTVIALSQQTPEFRGKFITVFFDVK